MTVLADARSLVFDERFRFDTFVTGEATRDAADAARVVAESPGARWNPLIVRGGPGQGKSHLLGAVAQRARELHPGRRVVALSAADGPLPSLGDASLVIVDDVRPGLDAARAEELRALVDAALAAGAQVVVAEEGASAVSREAATAWVERFPRARLVRLGAPDAEGRLAIVRNVAAARSLSLGDDVLATIARDPVDSVRDLLGRLTRVAASPDAPTSAGALALGDDNDFASFLDEVAREVAAYAEPWRVRLGEATARWRGEGFAVDVLERALRLSAAPDLDALLATFERAVARLRELERQAVAREEGMAGASVFRDPARIAAAEETVARLARAAEERAAAERAAAREADIKRTPPNAPSRVAIDAESWVLDWPDVRDLLVEAWR